MFVNALSFSTLEKLFSLFSLA